MFFGDQGGERAYRQGDMRVIDEIAAGFDYYAAKLQLPEYHSPMTFDQHFQLLKMRGIIT